MSDSCACQSIQCRHSIPFLRSISIVSAVPGNWCSPDQSTPILLVSSAYRFLASRVFLFGGRVGWLQLRHSGHAYHRSRRGTPRRGQYIDRYIFSFVSAAHIKLINESINAGLVAGQVLRRSHLAQGPGLKLSKPCELNRVPDPWYARCRYTKEPGGSM